MVLAQRWIWTASICAVDSSSRKIHAEYLEESALKMFNVNEGTTFDSPRLRGSNIRLTPGGDFVPLLFRSAWSDDPEGPTHEHP